MPDEILSQAEIDALLSSVAAEKKVKEELPGVKKEVPKHVPRTYDFTSPDKFSKENLRVLELIHENSTRILNSALSTYLRTIIQTNLVSVVEVSYEEFIKTLPNPTVICIFAMYPLEGNALLEINPKIIFFFYDRLLGGKGKLEEEKEEERELTDIERSVSESIFTRILSGLKDSWTTISTFNFRIERIESNPTFSQIVSSKDRVAHIIYEIKIGESKGVINLCLPHVLLEPVIPQLSTQYLFTGSQKREKEEDTRLIKKRLESIQLPLIVELGNAIINIRELLDLQVGDVIKLNNTVKENLKIKIGNKTKFFSQPGVLSGKVAVQITRKVEEEIGGE